tara:strand:- start:1755 stop:2501 length:747 start_codon:yes stop_codon:yes gene_type:complete
MKSPTGDPTPFGRNWANDTPASAPCAIYDMNQDGIWEYFGSGSPGYDYGGWVSCTNNGSFPCGNTPITQKWSCIDGLCTQDGIGPYTSYTHCVSSPCPPDASATDCKQCCKYLSDLRGGGYTYQKLLSNSTPCDCEFWLGMGWSPTSWGDCCVQQECPPGAIWNSIDCRCDSNDGPVDGPVEDGCIKTEECASGFVWSWAQCMCIPGEGPTNDCLKCCVSDKTGSQIQLALNATPCVCPVGYTETLCW